MIDFLEEMHFDENVGVDGKIGPEDIPISCIVAVLYFPVELLCNILDYCILCHWIEVDVLETLMTIFLRVLNLSMRSILGLRIYTFYSSF